LEDVERSEQNKGDSYIIKRGDSYAEKKGGIALQSVKKKNIRKEHRKGEKRRRIWERQFQKKNLHR